MVIVVDQHFSRDLRVVENIVGRQNHGAVVDIERHALTATKAIASPAATGCDHCLPGAKLGNGGGVEFALAADSVQSIRFSGGDIIYLSDLVPTSIEWRPYVPTRIAGDRLKKLYAPRFDQASDGGQLELEPGGDTYEKGIALHSRTELVYRLPAQFKRFQAEVGLDPRYRNSADSLLINSSIIPIRAQRTDIEVHYVAANDLAESAAGSAKSANVVALGALHAVRTRLESSALEAALSTAFAHKGAPIIDMNVRALHAGMDAMSTSLAR